MIVHCNCRSCVWNEDWTCKGPNQPAGFTALYLEETLGGQVICMDYKEKDEEENEEID